MQFKFEQVIGHGGVTMEYIAEIEDVAFARLQAEKISCNGDGRYASIQGNTLWCGMLSSQTAHDIDIYHINKQGHRVTFPGMQTYVIHKLGEKLGIPVNLDRSRY